MAGKAFAASKDDIASSVQASSGRAIFRAIRANKSGKQKGTKQKGTGTFNIDISRPSLYFIAYAPCRTSLWWRNLLPKHVRRYRQHYHGSGHIWQGRFKSFSIELDAHLLTVLRDVERNPVRAQLTQRAELWDWSIARFWKPGEEGPRFLLPGPVERLPDWLGWVNAAVTLGELESIRRSVVRGSPFGSATWTARIAVDLGLKSTLRPRGRPRIKGNGDESNRQTFLTLYSSTKRACPL